MAGCAVTVIRGLLGRRAFIAAARRGLASMGGLMTQVAKQPGSLQYCAAGAKVTRRSAILRQLAKWGFRAWVAYDIYDVLLDLLSDPESGPFGGWAISGPGITSVVIPPGTSAAVVNGRMVRIDSPELEKAIDWMLSAKPEQAAVMVNAIKSGRYELVGREVVNTARELAVPPPSPWIPIMEQSAATGGPGWPEVKRAAETSGTRPEWDGLKKEDYRQLLIDKVNRR